eukprot:5616154-Prymnesium_polylepis.2
MCPVCSSVTVRLCVRCPVSSACARGVPGACRRPMRSCGSREMGRDSTHTRLYTRRDCKEAAGIPRPASRLYV